MSGKALIGASRSSASELEVHIRAITSKNGEAVFRMESPARNRAAVPGVRLHGKGLIVTQKQPASIQRTVDQRLCGTLTVSPACLAGSAWVGQIFMM